MCSCRKHGLKCVTACEDYQGENCNNAEEILEVEEDNFEGSIAIASFNSCINNITTV